MPRSISGIIIVHGVDHEDWPFANEAVDYQHGVHMVLDVAQPAAAIGIPPVKWGGECRVELDLRAQVLDDRGAVQIRGEARFYEGDSEDTQDLEEQQTVELLVPRGGHPSSTTLTLHNSGFGGGDWATIDMSFTNSVFEDPDE